MSFTIKKSEIEAIKAVLEQDDLESADDMAKALIKTMIEELAKRETVAYVHRYPGGTTISWPFWYEKDARKFHEQHPPIEGGSGNLVRMRSPYLDDQLAEKHKAEIEKRMEGINWS